MNISEKINAYKKNNRLKWVDLAKLIDISLPKLNALRQGKIPATTRIIDNLLKMPNSPFVCSDFFE